MKSINRIITESINDYLFEITRNCSFSRKLSNNDFFRYKAVEDFSNSLPKGIRLRGYKYEKIYKEELLKKGYYLMPNASAIIKYDGVRPTVEINDNSKFFIDGFKKFMNTMYPEVQIRFSYVPYEEKYDENSGVKYDYCNIKIYIKNGKENY